MAPTKKDLASLRQELTAEFGEPPEATAYLALLGGAHAWCQWFAAKRISEGDKAKVDKQDMRFLPDELMPLPCYATAIAYLAVTDRAQRYFFECGSDRNTVGWFPRFADGTLETVLRWTDVRALDALQVVPDALKEAGRLLTTKHVAASLVRPQSFDTAAAARQWLKRQSKGKAQVPFWFWHYLCLDFTELQGREGPKDSLVARLAAVVGLEPLPPSLDEYRRRWETRIAIWRRKISAAEKR